MPTMPDKQLLESASVFLVSNVTASAEYYRDCLGFAFDGYWGEPPGFCMVWRDGHCIMLSQVADVHAIRPVSTVVPDIWDAYFWVKNIDTLFAEFVAQGARISYRPFLKPYGVKEGAVYDVDEYQLAFGQRIE